MIQPPSNRQSRLIKAAIGICASFALIACGANNTDTGDSTPVSESVEEFSTASIALYTAGSAVSKDTSGNNLIDMRGEWPSWEGSSTNIQYDSNTASLRLPATGNGEIAIAVRRFDQTLTEGAQYTLSIDAADERAAAVLYLLQANGELNPITARTTGVTANWARSSPGVPLSFIAPSGVVGFYLQVQSAWQESSAQNLAAELSFTGSNDQGGSQGTGQTAFFTLAGNWPDWYGKQTGIRYDANNNLLTLPPTGSSQGLVVGVRRYTQTLTAGQVYSLDTAGSTSGSAVILYLRNNNGAQISVTNADTGVTRDVVRVDGGQRTSFVAPDGIATIDVQLQSPWQASTRSTIRAELTNDGQTASPSPQPVPAPTPEPVPAPAPIPQPGPTLPADNGDYRPNGYNDLLLADEFNGTELDRGQWCTRLPYGGGPSLQVPDAECTKFQGQGSLDYANEEEQQRFRDYAAGTGEALHQVSDGTIRLRATRTGRNEYLRFEAAALRSKQVFKPEGGRSYYITSRVKLPDILGVWPALFLNPSLEPTGTSTWPPEIDIFEAPIAGTTGENRNTMIQHARIKGAQTASGQSEWTYATEGFNTEWGFYIGNANLRDRWIVIGAEWTETGVCYFINELKTGCENYRWVSNSGAPANAATLIMYLAVGGPWAGQNGIDDASFPAQMEVDYIRVYQK